MDTREAEQELARLVLDGPREGLARLEELTPLLESQTAQFISSWHAFWGCTLAEELEDWAQVETFARQALSSVHPDFRQYEPGAHAFYLRALYYQGKHDEARVHLGKAMEAARIRPDPHAVSILRVSASLGVFDDLVLMGTIAAAVMNSALGKKLPEPVDELAGAKYVARILAGYSQTSSGDTE